MCRIYSCHQSLVCTPDTRVMMIIMIRSLHFLIPPSACLDEHHMDQTCLCSTIWWPLLWFRKPSRRWMKEKKLYSWTRLCSLPVIPLWSSGWCLKPVSFLLNDGLGDFITRTQTTNVRIIRLFIIGTVPPKTITLSYIMDRLLREGFVSALAWPLLLSHFHPQLWFKLLRRFILPLLKTQMLQLSAKYPS